MSISSAIRKKIQAQRHEYYLLNKEEIKEEVKEEVKEESQEGEKEGNEKDLFSDPVVSLSQEAVNTSSVVQVPETTPKATENARQ